MSVSLLLVEDDKETSRHIVDVLGRNSYIVEAVSDGLKGLERARSGIHSGLIVDRLLPGLDGLSMVQQLRGEGNQKPILFLTSRSGLDDRVEGLRGGADDYLTKPFAFCELIARLNAILRMTRNKNSPGAARLKAADLEMDLIRRTVTRNGELIELRAKEFRLLECLMRNAGQIMTRKMLLEQVWDLQFDPRTAIIQARISWLRDKIERKGSPQLIHTIRQVGYILKAG